MSFPRTLPGTAYARSSACGALGIPVHWSLLGLAGVLLVGLHGENARGSRKGIFCQGVASHPGLVEGHARVGVAQVAGNARTEDRYSVRQLGPNALAVGVFDGHGGWQVAEWLSDMLPHTIASHLGFGSVPMQTWDGAPRTVLAALEASFHECDNLLLQKVDTAISELKFSHLGRIGSCALCVVIDPAHFFIANAGNCQALLVRGQRPIRLCSVHDADEPRERERLQAAHPGEGDLLVRGRDGRSLVKGRLRPTRSVGHFCLKDERLCADHEPPASSPLPGLPTPPYITAAPEVVAVPRHPRDEVLVLASEGLWEHVGQEDVVTLARSLLKASGSAVAPAQSLAQALADEAVRRGGAGAGAVGEEARRRPPGDVTVLVIHL